MNNFCTKEWVISLFKKIIESNFTASDGQKFKFVKQNDSYGHVTISNGIETFHKF